MTRKLHSILLVDDDHVTNMLNKMAIEKADIAETVTVKLNGKEAIEYLIEISEDRPLVLPPDLIFLDINMPVMDGWTFLEKYKNLREDQKSRIVLVMLTTSLNPEDKTRAENDPSISGFRSKPLSVEMIHDIASDYFPGH